MNENARHHTNVHSVIDDAFSVHRDGRSPTIVGQQPADHGELVWRWWDGPRWFRRTAFSRALGLLTLVLGVVAHGLSHA
jgi:hypothetical protein